MTDSACEEAIVRNNVSVCKGVSLIREYRQHFQSLSMERRYEALQAHFAKTYTGFKVFPEVEEWKRQYLPQILGKIRRCKFLVAVGPSNKGMSKWAASQFGQELAEKKGGSGRET